MEKVKQIIRYAAEHSPFYKELFAETQLDVAGDFDFDEIPFTIRHDIMSRGEDMVCVPRGSVVFKRNDPGYWRRTDSGDWRRTDSGDWRRTDSGDWRRADSDDWRRGGRNDNSFAEIDSELGARGAASEFDVFDEVDAFDDSQLEIPCIQEELDRQEDELTEFFEEVFSPESKLMILLPHDDPYDPGSMMERAARAAGADVMTPGRVGIGISYNRILDLIYDEGYVNIAGYQPELFDLMKYSTKPVLENLFLTGRYFSSAEERSLEYAWGCNVFRIYGSAVTGIYLAAGHADWGFIPAEEFLIEIIDPETGWPLKEGRLGELVITTLEPRALPLIRYRTGDMCKFKDGYLGKIGTVDDLMRFDR